MGRLFPLPAGRRESGSWRLAANVTGLLPRHNRPKGAVRQQHLFDAKLPPFKPLYLHPMERIEVRNDPPKVMRILLMIVWPFCFLAWLQSSSLTLGVVSFAAIPAALVLVTFQLKSPIIIEFDRTNNILRRTWRDAVGRKQVRTYQTDQFRYVQSWLTIGRFPTNVVALVSNSGGETLALATFFPSSMSSSFLSIPREAESENATQLRIKVAQGCGVIDRGFLGSRMPGCNVK